MHAYVLKEQGKWFEAECEFLINNSGLFKMFWDFARILEFLLFPLPKRNRVLVGITLAVRDDQSSISLLKKSIAHNQLNNVQVLHQPEHNQELPDLVRFSLDYNNGTTSKISRWIDAFAASSPLILASLRNPDGMDLSAYNLLRISGYMRTDCYQAMAC